MRDEFPRGDGRSMAQQRPVVQGTVTQARGTVQALCPDRTGAIRTKISESVAHAGKGTHPGIRCIRTGDIQGYAPRCLNGVAGGKHVGNSNCHVSSIAVRGSPRQPETLDQGWQAQRKGLGTPHEGREGTRVVMCCMCCMCGNLKNVKPHE